MVSGLRTGVILTVPLLGGNDLDSNPDGTLEALRLVQCTGGGDSFRS